MNDREITIVKIAFNKVKERFHVPVELKDITTEGNSIKLTYIELEDWGPTQGLPSLTYSQNFSPYWFDSVKWEQVMEPERKKIHKYLNYGVEKLVSPKLKYNEDTMATLRIAAKLYWVFKHSGLIR